MSKFSERCKQLLEENGANVYQLSETAGIERAKLQRITTGKQLPKPDEVKKFCHALRLTFRDESELMKLYHIEEIGEETWQNRQTIAHLFNELAQFEHSEYLNLHFPRKFDASDLPDSHASHTAAETDMLIYSLLAEECHAGEFALIQTNLSLKQEVFLQELSFLHHCGVQKLTVEHVLTFQRNAKHSQANLHKLCQILPLILSGSLHYHVFYTYVEHNLEIDATIPFPYFILSSKRLLMISADFCQAVLYSKKDVIHTFQNRFFALKKTCYTLLNIYDNPKNALKLYISTLNCTNASGNCDITYAPGPVDLISKSELQILMQNGLPFQKKLFPIALAAPWEKTSSYVPTSFFTKAGLDHFCKTGQLLGNMGMFLPPMDKEFRVKCLQHFLETFNQKGNGKRQILTDKLQLPSNLYIELCGKTSLHFIRLEADFHFTFLTITESSICEAFADFASSLPDSEYAYSCEETNQIIKESIANLTEGVYLS